MRNGKLPHIVRAPVIAILPQTNSAWTQRYAGEHRIIAILPIRISRHNGIACATLSRWIPEIAPAPPFWLCAAECHNYCLLTQFAAINTVNANGKGCVEQTLLPTPLAF